MKVQVTYTEIQEFKLEKEVEMTQKEYKQYLKTGLVNVELQEDLTSECGDKNWCGTSILNIIVEKQ